MPDFQSLKASIHFRTRHLTNWDSSQNIVHERFELMKECKQIPTPHEGKPTNPDSLRERYRTIPHENKNLTSKQNSVEKVFWLIRGNDSKPLSSTRHKNKKNPRVGCESP
jgi:hypothetical protein